VSIERDLTVSPSVLWYTTNVVGSITCEMLSRFCSLLALSLPPGRFAFEVVCFTIGYLRGVPWRTVCLG
jgi:hypothetical protein